MQEALSQFRTHLIREEKSPATVDKYLRDASVFLRFTEGGSIDKELVLAYKADLQKNYRTRSVNSMLASVNSLLGFLGRSDCRVKILRSQTATYSSRGKELTKADYLRLLKAAGEDLQLKLILQTLGSTGIRISELKYFTVEAIKEGHISVRCKSKTRTVLLPKALRCQLKDFIKCKQLTSGPIFLGKNGKPVNRSCVWRQMKRLCEKAGVDKQKVFPHNFRKLFARTYYRQEKDIAKLADLLGHSSINTTRIYIMSTAEEHQRQINRMDLVPAPEKIKIAT